LTRNINHFGQANDTPFCQQPLLAYLDYDGINDTSKRLILEGQIPVEIQQLSPHLDKLLEHLSDGNNLPTIESDLSYEEFVRGMKKWNERTTTSPSGRHLGHYKILTRLQIMDKEKNINISNTILHLYYLVCMTAANIGGSLNRWRKISTCMIEKVPGSPRIDKLRVIHLFEADFNMLIKIMWARKGVWHMHDKNAINHGQAGSRPGKRAIDVVIQKEMKYLYAITSRTVLGTIDNNATSCYDRMICNFSMLISLYYGIPENYCKLLGNNNVIFLFPDDSFLMNDICCHRIGHGESICVKTHCETQHRGSKVSIRPGTNAVSKNRYTVFAEPLTNKNKHERDIVEQWKSADNKRSLDTWRELFLVSNAVQTGDKISAETLSKAQGLFGLAHDCKSLSASKVIDLTTARVNTLNVTPAEDPGSFVDLMMTDPEPLLTKRKAVDEFNEHQVSTKRINVTDETELSSGLASTQRDLAIGDARLYAIASKIDGKELFFSNEVKVLLFRLETVEGKIGNPILADGSIFQSPTIWGSIAALATEVEECVTQQINSHKESAARLLSTEEDIKAYTITEIRMATDRFFDKMNMITNSVQTMQMSQRTFDDSIMAVARGSVKIKEDLHRLNQTIQDHQNDRALHPNGFEITESIRDEPNVGMASSKLDEVFDKVSVLSKQVMQLRSEYDGEAIKFFGLGFKDPKEAEVWTIARMSMSSTLIWF
jgi:hypothetical protein